LGPEIHFPNLDAVDWFLTNCWTSLKNCFPDLQFEVVGKWKKETRTKYEKLPGVKFHGYVEELDEVLEGAIMVVPLRIGSGMRMKILEGASWHMPIVSTPIGAEGLPMENGHNCFLAEKASDFVEAVGKLIENKELQVQFIENSKEIIRVDYSIEDCGKRRLEIFENLVATNAG
jgi:glycosyltransferase involved in cell wall biosynthesis